MNHFQSFIRKVLRWIHYFAYWIQRFGSNPMRANFFFFFQIRSWRIQIILRWIQTISWARSLYFKIYFYKKSAWEMVWPMQPPYSHKGLDWTSISIAWLVFRPTWPSPIFKKSLMDSGQTDPTRLLWQLY